jgi:hypothetical protein
MSVYIIPGFFRRKKFYQPLLDRLQKAGLSAEIIDLGMNVRNAKHSEQIVSRYLKKTEEKDDIIAHSFGGLILKQILVSDPKITALIKSISFVAVPHQGSWAALLVPIWPATLNMLPFNQELKKTAEAVLPESTMNFLPETEFKIWPKSSARLNDFVDAVIPHTDHDSIIASQDFAGRVIEFIKTCT